jgi:hypothetical protein
MAYETFEKTAVRMLNPTISVGTDGRIAINAAACRLFEKLGTKSVTLLWDKAVCGVALQAAQKGDKNAYSVSFSAGRSGTITAKSFLNHIGWSSDHRQTVPATWDERRKMLEAKLPSRWVGKREQKDSKHQTSTGQ